MSCVNSENHCVFAEPHMKNFIVWSCCPVVKLESANLWQTLSMI